MRTAFAIPALLLAACASPPPPVRIPAAPPRIVQQPAPPPLVHVQVLAVNDFHGYLEPPHGFDGMVRGADGALIPTGGAAYVAAHVHRLAAENPNTVVVSAGDLTGASPLVSSLFADEPTILAMNRIGLDFEAVGNHDFDRGLVELYRRQRGGRSPVAPPSPLLPDEAPFPGARFQYLAANVRGPDGTTIFPAYAIKELGGVKVAFVGMTLEGTPSVTAASAIPGLSFANEAATANALLPELRQRGVATAVLVLHQGGFQEKGGTYDSCVGLSGEILPVLHALDPAFRVVVTGHTHQAYDCEVDGRRVTSAASFGRLVTAIDLTIDPATNQLTDVHARNVPVTRDIPPDPDVAKLVADYVAKARPVTDRVVGYQRGVLASEPKGAHSQSCETPLGDLIADAMLAATRNTGAVIAFMNPGGIRTDLVPETSDPVAPIRYAEAFEIEPFGNRLVTISLTGDDLLSALQHQFGHDRPRVLSVSKGFSYRYTYDKAANSAAIDPKSIRLDGRTVDPKRRYRVTLNSFLADGAFAKMRDAGEPVTGVLDIEALVAFLGRSSPKAPVSAPARLDRILGNGCE